MAHRKARTSPYLNGPARTPLSDEQVPWEVPLPKYDPVDYTAPSVLAGPVWADKEAEIRAIRFNTRDGLINRESHEGPYRLDANNTPINRHGRTGMRGRGLLGRFGPNHAADPIVTRWQRDANGKRVLDASGRPILEFIAIKRRDNGQWAIPGGMVDAGECVSVTLKREFGEEALNSMQAPAEERAAIERSLDAVFSTGVLIYKGYVDDPRNTDNAWMETVAYNFHDEEGTGVAKFKLHAGDDAGQVTWMPITPHLQLFASHLEFITTVRRLRQSEFAHHAVLANPELDATTALRMAFQDAVAKSRSICVITGSELSEISGVPSYTSELITYRQFRKANVAHISTLDENPSLLWQFINFEREVLAQKHPNKAHFALAALEEAASSRGQQFSIVTMNVDRLHQAASSNNVLESNGSLLLTRCLKCHKVEENRSHPIVPALEAICAPQGETPELADADLPHCSECNGLLRPHVSLTGESDNRDVAMSMAKLFKECDLCVIVGTDPQTEYPESLTELAVMAPHATLAEFRSEPSSIGHKFQYGFHGDIEAELQAALNLPQEQLERRRNEYQARLDRDEACHRVSKRVRVF